MIKLVVGLGNPGKEYEKTRHNIGFMFLDFIKSQYPDKKYLYPQDFMNNSGKSIAKEAGYFKIHAKEILVVHDDMDIEVGEYRLQFDRGSAGHNGVKSTMEHLQTQAFWRLRIGIGKPVNIVAENYVLQPFLKEERAIIQQVFEKIQNDPSFQRLLQ